MPGYPETAARPWVRPKHRPQTLPRAGLEGKGVSRTWSEEIQTRPTSYQPEQLGWVPKPAECLAGPLQYLVGGTSGRVSCGALSPVRDMQLAKRSTGPRSSEGRAHLTPRDLTCRTGRGQSPGRPDGGDALSHSHLAIHQLDNAPSSGDLSCLAQLLLLGSSTIPPPAHA